MEAVLLNDDDIRRLVYGDDFKLLSAMTASVLDEETDAKKEDLKVGVSGDTEDGSAAASGYGGRQ